MFHAFFLLFQNSFSLKVLKLLPLHNLTAFEQSILIQK